jgi:hypothetical protein
MFDARPPKALMIGAGTAKDCSATGVFAYTLNLLENARVWRLIVKVTVVMVSTGGIVITFRRRPLYGSAGSGSTAQTVLGTVTVPATAAVNSIYYNDITPVNINAGDQLVCDCTTAATTSGSAFGDVLWDYDPEAVLNEAAFTAKVSA